MDTNSMKAKNANILVKVNGEDLFIEENLSILNLLDNHQISKDKVVIELNKEILPKDRFHSTILHQNDSIEIVTFVGGG